MTLTDSKKLIKREITCPKCKYTYKTASQKTLVTCASCGRKINIIENLNNKNKEE